MGLKESAWSGIFLLEPRSGSAVTTPPSPSARTATKDTAQSNVSLRDQRLHLTDPCAAGDLPKPHGPAGIQGRPAAHAAGVSQIGGAGLPCWSPPRQGPLIGPDPLPERARTAGEHPPGDRASAGRPQHAEGLRLARASQPRSYGTLQSVRARRLAPLCRRCANIRCKALQQRVALVTDTVRRLKA